MMWHDLIVIDVLIPIATAVLSGVTVYLLQKMIARQDEDKAAEEARDNAMLKSMRIILFDYLQSIHAKYVLSRSPVPIDVKRHAQEIYDAYRSLGGDGIGTRMNDDIQASTLQPR